MTRANARRVMLWTTNVRWFNFSYLLLIFLGEVESTFQKMGGFAVAASV